MIPIVEELLENIIETQLALIKADPNIIEKIFNYSNSNYTKDFKDFISNNDIAVIKNFPRTTQTFPCYCIMLGEESERPESLGDYLETSSDIVGETNIYQILQDENNEFYIDTGKALTDVTTINNLTNGKEIQECALDESVTGRIILKEYSDLNDTVEATFHYTQEDMAKSGTLMEFSYRIECWSDNSNFVVYMYHLLKFIMLYKRQLLIESGIVTPILRGTDLEPVPDYMPTFVFRRSLLIQGAIENYYDSEEIKNAFYTIDNIVLTQHLYEQ